eukprot:493653-Pelagomonas_calceolata.AAC.7
MWQGRFAHQCATQKRCRQQIIASTRRLDALHSGQGQHIPNVMQNGSVDSCPSRLALPRLPAGGIRKLPSGEVGPSQSRQG